MTAAAVSSHVVSSVRIFIGLSRPAFDRYGPWRFPQSCTRARYRVRRHTRSPTNRLLENSPEIDSRNVDGLSTSLYSLLEIGVPSPKGLTQPLPGLQSPGTEDSTGVNP